MRPGFCQHPSWRSSESLPLLFANRHQSQLQHSPNRDSEDKNSEQAVPGPIEVPRLDRKNRNHEIIAEARVADEGAVARITPAHSAHQRDDADEHHEDRDHDVHGEEGVKREVPLGVRNSGEVLAGPMRATPQEAEAGLYGGVK